MEQRRLEWEATIPRSLRSTPSLSSSESNAVVVPAPVALAVQLVPSTQSPHTHTQTSIQQNQLPPPPPQPPIQQQQQHQHQSNAIAPAPAHVPIQPVVAPPVPALVCEFLIIACDCLANELFWFFFFSLLLWYLHQFVAVNVAKPYFLTQVIMMPSRSAHAHAHANKHSQAHRPMPDHQPISISRVAVSKSRVLAKFWPKMMRHWYMQMHRSTIR